MKSISKLHWYSLAASGVPTHYVQRASIQEADFAANNHLGMYQRDYKITQIRKPPVSWIRARITLLKRLVKNGPEDLAAQRRREARELRGMIAA